MNGICKDCRKPVHWVPGGTEMGGAWYHDKVVDVFDCPGRGMVRVAEATIPCVTVPDDQMHQSQELCGYCGAVAVGYARLSDGTRVCHSDERSCYNDATYRRVASTLTPVDEVLEGEILLSLSDDLLWLADRFPQMRAQALAMRAQVRRELGKDDPEEEGNEQ